MRLHKNEEQGRHYFWVVGDLGAVSWEVIELPEEVGAKLGAIWDHPVEMPAYMALPKPVQQHEGRWWMSMTVAQHYPANRRSGHPCDLVETGYCNIRDAITALLGPQLMRDWFAAGQTDHFVVDALERYYLEMKDEE